MFNRLSVLKEKGYYPDTILDIGAYHGNWTKSMSAIYGDSKYFLFEMLFMINLNYQSFICYYYFKKFLLLL
jgi:hypothetical protein